MLFHVGYLCEECERLEDRQFMKVLQAQGHSFSEVFAIILDMEYHVKSRREFVINQAIRRGTVDGYLYFKKDEIGAWHVLLTELGHQRKRDKGIS